MKCSASQYYRKMSATTKNKIPLILLWCKASTWEGSPAFEWFAAMLSTSWLFLLPKVRRHSPLEHFNDVLVTCEETVQSAWQLDSYKEILQKCLELTSFTGHFPTCFTSCLIFQFQAVKNIRLYLFLQKIICCFWPKQLLWFRSIFFLESFLSIFSNRFSPFILRWSLLNTQSMLSLVVSEIPQYFLPLDRS